MHDNCVGFGQISNPALELHYFSFQKRGLRSAAISPWWLRNSLSFGIETWWMLMSLAWSWMATHSIFHSTWLTKGGKKIKFCSDFTNSFLLSYTEVFLWFYWLKLLPIPKGQRETFLFLHFLKNKCHFAADNTTKPESCAIQIDSGSALADILG